MYHNNNLMYIRTMEYSFDHVRLNPSEQIGRHQQSCYELSHIITGCGTRTIGSKSEPFESGEVILVPPRIPHEWRFGTDVVDSDGNIENFSVHFHPSLLENISRLFPELEESFSNLLNISEALRYEGEQRERIIDLLYKIEKASRVDRVCLIILLLDNISKSTDATTVGSVCRIGTAESRMEKIRIYVSCNHARKIRLGDIAAHIGMYKSAFCAFFRQQTDTTFISWLNAFRIQRAQELLSSGKMAVSDVAAAVGFDSPAHFTRTFHSQIGMSPSEYSSMSECGQSNAKAQPTAHRDDA